MDDEARESDAGDPYRSPRTDDEKPKADGASIAKVVGIVLLVVVGVPFAAIVLLFIVCAAVISMS